MWNGDGGDGGYIRGRKSVCRMGIQVILYRFSFWYSIFGFKFSYAATIELPFFLFPIQSHTTIARRKRNNGA